MLNGSVLVGDRVYVNPAPTTLLWRPDRLTARYHIEPGVREIPPAPTPRAPPFQLQGIAY